MAYTQDGIMAQIWVAFGQGTGAIRVSQEAALELHRWYFDAITPPIVAGTWDIAAVQVLDRIRAIGSLAALKAMSAGATAISPRNVYEAAAAVQASSATPLCPPEPPVLGSGEDRPRDEARPAAGADRAAAGRGQAGVGADRLQPHLCEHCREPQPHLSLSL